MVHDVTGGTADESFQRQRAGLRMDADPLKILRRQGPQYGRDLAMNRIDQDDLVFRVAVVIMKTGGEQLFVAAGKSPAGPRRSRA